MAQVELGERIATLREEQALTQADLAERARISPSTLSQIESGRVPRPHVGTIRKIARALNVEPQDLRRTEEPALAGKVKAPKTGHVEEVDLPQVQAWLQEQDAVFALMSSEDFVEVVAGTESLEDLEELARAIAEERRQIEQELDNPVVRQALFPPDMQGLSTKRAREHEAMRPARDAWKLRWELSHAYLVKELALSNYSKRLYIEGKVSDFLIHPRRAETMSEAERHEIEEARRKEFREALVQVGAA
jgi:transcriptional regulator with XRE-family HTH domain